MTMNGWVQIAIYFGLIAVCVKPLGLYMAKVFEGERTFLSPVLGPVERVIYSGDHDDLQVVFQASHP